MERKKIIFSICLIASSCYLFADTYSEGMNKVAELRKLQPKQAIQQLEQIITIDELSNKQLATVHYQAGTIYYYELSDKENALRSFYNALKYYRQIKHVNGEYACLTFLALAYKNLYHYDYAQTYYEEILSLNYLNNSQRNKAQYNLANTWRLQGQFEKSITLLKKLIEVFEKDRDWDEALESRMTLALAFLESESYIEAARNYQEILLQSDTSDLHQEAKSKAINSLGYIFLQQKQFGKAEEYLLHGLALKADTDDTQSLLMSYSNLGVLYSSIGNSEKALEYFQLGSELEESSVNHQNLIEVLEELVTISTNEKDLSSALSYQKRISDIQNPYVALSNRLEILHKRYKAERVKNLHEQLELQAKVTETQNRNLIITLTLLALALLSGTLIFIQQKKRMVDKSLRKWLIHKNRLLYFIAGKYGIDLKHAEKELNSR